MKKPRLVRYTTYWSYLPPGIKRHGDLADLMLDIPYLIDNIGVIPPLAVLNQVLQRGGDNGGMGPGTKWRPFTVDEADYEVAVTRLLALDMSSVQERHPYSRFDRAIVDHELNACTDYLEWLGRRRVKYGPK